MKTIAERFWPKVDRSGKCWIWMAGLTSTGYGQFSMGGRKGRTWKAHRVAYLLTHGSVPPELDHTCHNPKCVRPSHLEGVTHAENMKRAGRRKTHCIRGHDYSVFGKIARRHGRRYCTACWGKRG